MNTNDNQSTETRQGWREDGRVDIDAVRAGTHDVNDSAAVFESLCDEVEQLREQNAKQRALYLKNVNSLIDQLDEATATKAPERMVAEEILKALDVPRHANWKDGDAHNDLVGARLAFVRGYVGSALENDTLVTSMPRLADSASKQFPVAYEVEGGVR